MTHDAVTFFSEDIPEFIREHLKDDNTLIEKSRQAVRALRDYGNNLRLLPSDASFAVGSEALADIIDVNLGHTATPEEILRAAEEGFARTRETIQNMAQQIDGQSDWQTILQEKLPALTSHGDVLPLYRKQVDELRQYVIEHDVLSIPPDESIDVLETPSYLQSLRATGSYRAPLTGRSESHGVFFVTPDEEDLTIIAGQCPYLSAHETYPGHHILDHVRRHHPNPVRRQIESPLFYEGWACYVESLLDEWDYVTDPCRRLVQQKRQLWRSLRAILDIRLQSETMTLEEAVAELEALGYNRARAVRQIRRFALTPGYQLCYFTGMQEILRLRKRFSSATNHRHFHDILLHGGEIPFHLAEKRLQACAKQKKAHNSSLT
jgi:uncharacterized protein (DUF885 family)